MTTAASGLLTMLGLPPPRPLESNVSRGNNSLAVKISGDETSVGVAYEEEKDLIEKNFNVWIIPCYAKAKVKVALEGEVSVRRDMSAAGAKLQVKLTGLLEVGGGRTFHFGTAGPFGSAALSASQGIAVERSATGEVEVDAFALEVCGVGTVGIKAEVTSGPRLSFETRVANWQLYVVHVAGYRNGKFTGVHAEPGRDLQRLIAEMQKAGPKIADAVEQYAPEFAKKAAVDGARWAAENPRAGEIAEQTRKVLDGVQKKAGVDVGSGVEQLVRTLCDPGGETSAQTKARIEQGLIAFNASHGEFHAVMSASGLDTELRPPCRTKEEYNAIVDVWLKEAEAVAHGGTAAGAWRPMIQALVVKARKRKSDLEAGNAKPAGERDEADLAQRVKRADMAMAAALDGANYYGNPLDARTQGLAKSNARAYWTAAMVFWRPGAAAHTDALSLTGEARIAKAQEAARLLDKAKVVFKQGMQRL